MDANIIAFWSCVSSWAYTLITVGIAYFAYRAYAVSQHQRQVENAFKLVSLFNEALDNIHLEHQFESSEGIQIIGISGRNLLNRMIETQAHTQRRNKRGRWVPSYVVSREAFPWAEQTSYAEYIQSELFWCEGQPDKGLLQRCCELFNLIGKHICDKSADATIINFYLGQYMTSIYNWLAHSEHSRENFEKMYRYYWKAYVKHKRHIAGWIEDSYPTQSLVERSGKFVGPQEMEEVHNIRNIPGLSASFRTENSVNKSETFS